MRIIFISLALFLAAAGLGAGGYLYLARAVEPGPLPPGVVVAEDALGLEETFGLLHLNVAYALEVESELLGEADRNALMAPLTEGESLAAVLTHGGVDLRDSLDQVLAALVLGEEGPGGVAVALGRFEVDRILELLPKVYQVETSELAGEPVLLLVKEDPMTCQLSSPQALHLTPERLVVGSPALVGVVLERLAAGSAPAIDLAPWRAYREGKLLSLALLRPPAELVAQTPHPMVQMGAKAGEKDLAKIGQVYAGASFQALPPRLLFETRIASDDPAWAGTTAESYATWAAELAGGVGQDLPAVTKLVEHLSVEAEGPLLVAQTALGEDFLNDAAQLPGEALRLVFAGMGMSGSGSSDLSTAALPEEQIVPPEEVAAYRAQLSHAELSAFDPALDQSFEGAAGSGPFVIKIDAFRLAEGEEGLVELEIDAMSGELPNMTVDSMHGVEDRERAKLFVTAVLNAAGENLLREERCGPDRNSKPGELQASTRYSFEGNVSRQVPVVSGSKSLRLKPGAGVNDIAGIQGFVELRLPTRTEVFRVEAPFDQKVVEVPGVRIKLNAGGPGEIAYEVSGEIDRVLAVRGLNAAGQQLRGAGSFSSGRLMGAGKSVGKSFAGNPESVEFVIATEDSAERYPFEITQVAPQFDTWDWPKAYQVAATTPQEFSQAAVGVDLTAACEERPADGQLQPFQICPQSIQAQWGALQGQFKVLAPDLPGLMGNLSGLELRLDGVRLPEGVAVPIDLGSYLRLREVYDADHLEDTPWVSAEAPEALDNQSIAAVQGRLIARLPTALARVTLDVSDLGSRVTHPNGLDVHLVGFFNGSLQLDVAGPREHIVQFVPRDAAGGALATNNSRIDETDEPGRWRASLSVSGRPQSLDIVFAETQEQQEYPFDLTIDAE